MSSSVNDGLPHNVVLEEDCLKTMRLMANGTIDTVLTDLDFDHVTALNAAAVAELYRTCKSGAFVVALEPCFNYHRVTSMFEDGGFEIRDCIVWLFEGERGNDWRIIVLAMKPCEGTFAQNAEKHGVAGMNIRGCRLAIEEADDIYAKNPHTFGTIGKSGIYGDGRETLYNVPEGRFPANVVVGNTTALFIDGQSGVSLSSGGQASLGAFRNGKVYGKGKDVREQRDPGLGDYGGASRFFAHADDKIALFVHLCTLTQTPYSGVVYDPFVGDGSTIAACQKVGRPYIGSRRQFRVS